MEELADAIEPYASIEGEPRVSRASKRPTERPKSKPDDATKVGSGTPSPEQRRVAATQEGVGGGLGPVAPTPQPKSAPMAAPAPTPAAVEPTKPRWPYAALALGALIAVAGGLAVVATSDDPDPDPEPEPPPITEVEPDPPVMEATMQATGMDTPEAAEVRLRVVVAPADATILLDGVEFPSPLDSQRPRSLEPVQLRIEREGYQTHEELVVLDRDHELIRTLERSRSAMSTMSTTTMQTVQMTVTMEPTMETTTMMDGFRDEF